MKRSIAAQRQTNHFSSTWMLIYMATLVSSAEYTCPSHCICTDAIHFEIECDTTDGYFELTSARAPTHITLTCFGSTPDCSELTELKASLPPLTTQSLELRDCSLPSGSIACMADALGITNLTSLTIRDPPASDRLLRRHVIGLHAVDQLSLVGVEWVSSILTALPVLRRLVVRNSNVSLTADMFNNAPAIEYLELSASSLIELPKSAFRGLNQLRILSLWGNRIQNISAGAFEGLDSLERLDLSSNMLRTVDKVSLSGAMNLKTIKILGNPLERLELSGFQQLEDLAVVDCRAELSLGENALSELPALSSLRIEKCKLNDLPPHLFRDTTALLELFLARNNIQHLPTQLLQDSTSLLRLDLSGNRITSLDPKFFAQLNKLKELVLDDNPIEEFPPEVFSGLASVERISCARCGVQRIGRASFPMRLKQLELTGNNLTGLQALPALEILDLSYNRVTTMQDDWRLVMIHLNSLNLSHNAIERITEAELDFLSTDLEIDLRYNNITSIELSGIRIEDVDEERIGPKLWIDHNPFSCDCLLLGLVNTLASQPTSRSVQLHASMATCATPIALAGIPLANVPFESLNCDLPSTACPVPCNCTLYPVESKQKISCDTWPPANSLPDPANYDLNTTSLRVKTAPAPRLNELPSHVHHLDLSSLKLTVAPIPPVPLTLNSIDLSRNDIRRAPLELLELAKHLTIFMAGNPLECTCALADEIRELQKLERRITDAELLTCDTGGLIMRLDAARLCATRTIWIAAALGACVALIALATSAIALRRLGLPLRVWLHARGWLPDWLEASEEDADRQYDVFVSFSHADSAIVVERLLPGLEESGLRVCVHYRDWTPGELIPDQIVKSVAASRRTVVLLSRAFLASEWARAEFRAAHVRALREGRARVVAVLVDDAKVLLADAKLDEELRSYLASNTYLEIADPWFWDKLRYALRRRRNLPAAPEKY